MAISEQDEQRLVADVQNLSAAVTAAVEANAELKSTVTSLEDRVSALENPATVATSPAASAALAGIESATAELQAATATPTVASVEVSQVNPGLVETGADSMFDVSVTLSDGTVEKDFSPSWTCSAGHIETPSTNPTATVVWVAPATSGTYIVSCSVAGVRGSATVSVVPAATVAADPTASPSGTDTSGASLETSQPSETFEQPSASLETKEPSADDTTADSETGPARAAAEQAPGVAGGPEADTTGLLN